jgi:hypothetical protein
MRSASLKRQNFFSVVITLVIVPVYAAVLASGVVAFGRTLVSAILTVVSVLISVICYFLHLVQGLRSIGNGQASTSKTVAMLQVVLYALDLIWVVYQLIHTRTMVDSGPIIAQLVFGAIFLLLFLSALARTKALKAMEGITDTAFEGETVVAVKVFGWLIAFPIVIFVLIKAGMKLIAKYPVISKVLGISGALIFMGLLIFIVLKLLSKGADLFGGDLTPDAPSAPKSTWAKSAAPKASGPSDKDVAAFDALYEKRYRQVTGGESPWNHSILKEGPKLEAARKLRVEFGKKAADKGYLGKSKFFK